jgi:L-alanine-DL-glutamate epimerase-like enolase superfamily enzyme
MILETVRGFHRGWYESVYTDKVMMENGCAFFPTAPGLGTRLKPEFLADTRTTSRMSSRT